MARSTRSAARRRSRSTSAPVDLRFEYRDSAGVHAVKEFHLSAVVLSGRLPVDGGGRRPAAEARGSVGPRDRGRRRGQPLRGKGRRTALSERQSRATDSGRYREAARAYDGNFNYAGVDDNYFMTVALGTGPSKVNFQPVSIPPPDGLEGAAARAGVLRDRAGSARRADPLLRRTERFRRAQRDRSANSRWRSTSGCSR